MTSLHDHRAMSQLINYLPTLPNIRKFAPEWLKIIKEEVAKLIKVKVIIESHYPDWLANVVVAPKKGGSGKYVLTSPTLTKHA